MGILEPFGDTECQKIMSMHLKGTINYSVTPLIVDKKYSIKSPPNNVCLLTWILQIRGTFSSQLYDSH